VTAHEALADLMEISSQVEAAVVMDAAGDPLASTLEGDQRAADLAQAGRELLAAAERVRSSGGAAVTQLDAATRAGSVFVVREGELTIAATTAPSPTVGLVFYDLKTCLRAFAADADGDPDGGAEPEGEAEPNLGASAAEPEEDGDAAA
jgi:predicted regulator of Ras-like GTPase activity (Roadblock/LC7/MglB family)